MVTLKTNSRIFNSVKKIILKIKYFKKLHKNIEESQQSFTILSQKSIFAESVISDLTGDTLEAAYQFELLFEAMANIEALSEALVLSQKAGVDPEKVFNAIRGGLAGSAVMEAKGPMMLNRNFQAGFRIRLHQKDLRNVLQTAQELNVPLPVTSLLQQVLGALVNEGESESDHSAILKFVEDLAKVQVKSGG